MKKKTEIVRLSVCAFGMIALILDSKTALSGCREGITLCLNVVIPSLFPFFVLSVPLTQCLCGVRAPIASALFRGLGVPSGCEGILLVGLLGGYPMGAQSVETAWRSGCLDRKSAERMLAFTSFAGPSFLFGMTAACFPGKGYIWLLWAVHILSAILIGWCYPGKNDTVGNTPAGKQGDLMVRAVSAMAKVCGWVIVFRVLLGFLTRWFLWLLPEEGQVLFSGILELTNGILGLERIRNVGLRFVMGAGFLGFGGVCVTLQAFSVAGALGKRHYLIGKLLHGTLSVILAYLLQAAVFPGQLRWRSSPLPFLVCLMIPGFLYLFRKKGRYSRPVPV